MVTTGAVCVKRFGASSPEDMSGMAQSQTCLITSQWQYYFEESNRSNYCS
jgi:hypothetical protein